MPLLGSEEAGQGSIETAAGAAAQGTPGGPFPGFGGAPPPVAPASSAGVSGLASMSDHTHAGVKQVASSTDGVIGATTAAAIATLTQNIVATWGSVGTIGYFACDTAAGNDANAGFSTVSQAAAGAVAVKTLARLTQIIPRFGNGRQARVAIKSGNYASDTQFHCSQFSGYQKMVIGATDTVASAASVAFQGDTNDALCAGMTTATGMNAAGYNVTAYAVDGFGTTTATLQLAGGGAPGFGAMPARPYGCRLRGDAATVTPALRNSIGAIIFVSGGATVTLSMQLAAVPAAGDVFYIEMPNVTGPAQSFLNYSGIDSNAGNPALQLSGINLGTIESAKARVRISGCEANNILAVDSDLFVAENALTIGAASTFEIIGPGLRYTGLWNTTGGFLNLTSLAGGTSTTIWNEPTNLLWERSASGGQMNLYGGAHAGGNNIIETIGTNSSTVHGSTCQIWGHGGTPTGTLACGLFLGGGGYGGRINFSNMGANPAVRVCGAGLGVCAQGFTGGVADGNTDVGLDLGPDGLSGNLLGSVGSTIAVVGSPNVTGSNGDIRTAGGEIVSWAAVLATGFADRNGNRLCSTTGPLGIVGKFSGVLVQQPVAASLTYLSDVGELATPGAYVNDGIPQNYLTSQRLITRLRVMSKSGTGANALVVTLYKNATAGGAGATTQTVTIPAGSAPGTAAVDLAHPILFADGDSFDVVASMASGTGDGPYFLSAVLEGPC